MSIVPISPHTLTVILLDLYLKLYFKIKDNYVPFYISGKSNTICKVVAKTYVLLNYIRYPPSNQIIEEDTLIDTNIEKKSHSLFDFF